MAVSSKSMSHLIIPTCETAVSAVPEWHRALFSGHEETLHSARGWSPGALNLAQGFAIKLHAPLLHNEVTQLLIKLSCHPDDEARWSEDVIILTPQLREKIESRHQTPFLSSLRQRIQSAFTQERLPVHLSCDTADIASPLAVEFEFDPRRDAEAELVTRWEARLREVLPDIQTGHRSAPSRSLGSYLREQFPELASIRLIAASSSFLSSQPVPWATLKKHLIDTFPKD